MEKLQFLVFPTLIDVISMLPLRLPAGQQLLAFDDFNFTSNLLLPGERC